MTSPAYWGLRDYGTEPVIWGGDPECKHEWGSTVRSVRRSPRSDDVEIVGSSDGIVGRGPRPASSATQFCQLCNAWRGSLGLEPNLDLYISHLVEIFREARRVMKPEAICWINMGDGYAGSWSGNSMRPEGGTQRSGKPGFQPLDYRYAARNGAVPAGLKPKDLIGQPWRLAFALQADGWWLRSDIIWAKPDPMPESVSGTGYYRHKIRQTTNGKKEWVNCPGCEKCNPHGGYVLRWNAGRPTKSHEYIFLLSKSAKYYFDAEAIKEKEVCGRTRGPALHPDLKSTNGNNGLSRRKNTGSRNKRTVWTVATQPFPAAHFATFPEKLIEPCIRAGTSEKGYCAECGKPWVRVMEKVDSGSKQKMADGWDTGAGGHGTIHRDGAEKGQPGIPITINQTLGWQPSCSCGADIIPGLVLDPFGGAGTVALEAKKLNRDFLIIELKPEYCDMSRRRLAERMPLFVGGEVGKG